MDDTAHLNSFFSSNNSNNNNYDLFGNDFGTEKKVKIAW